MKFNSTLKQVSIYQAGKSIELLMRDYNIKPKNIIKLASNENPNGYSKKVKKVLNQHLSNIYMYPDDSMDELKATLSKHFQIKSTNIIIGAGSDQVIDFCIKAKCDKTSKILIAKTTFAMYEIYAKQIGVKVIKTKDDTHNLKQFYKLYNKYNPDMIFLCLPNNPLGDCLDAKDIYRFLDKIDKNTLVVLDGAYQEYASFRDKSKRLDIKYLLKKYQNIVYLGTFSKAYGLGGLRVGYGISNPNIINTLYKLRPPFNITSLSLIGAVTALKEQNFIQKSIKQNFIQMKRYEKYFKKQNLAYIPSWTNFITFYPKASSKEISNQLLKRGLIVRDLSSYGLNAIRITIGKPKQNTKVFTLFDEFLCK